MPRKYHKRKKYLSVIKVYKSKAKGWSNEKHQEIEVGSTVRVFIPDVDRALEIPRDLLAITANFGAVSKGAAWAYILSVTFIRAHIF